MQTYRVGFIGCGGISRAHADGYKHAGNAQIEFVAGSDIHPEGEKARRLADESGIKLYADYHDMLHNESLDLISICTWPRGHCEATVAAAAHVVKGIMCEKPMAVNLEEADRMIRACDEAGVTLAIGHAHRFSPQAVQARALAQAGEIGTIKMIWGHCSLDLMNNGTHVIDLINYLNGDADPLWVMGQIERHRNLEGRGNHPDMMVEDMAIGRVGYSNGVVGLIELGERADQAFAFRIIGSDGIIEVNTPEGPPLKVLSGFRQRGWYAPELSVTRSNFHGEIEELIDAVEGRVVHRSNPKNARRALEIIMGIFESSCRRTALDFPIDVRDFPLERMIREEMI
jgi:predicted dehydrogenase